MKLSKILFLLLFPIIMALIMMSTLSHQGPSQTNSHKEFFRTNLYKELKHAGNYFHFTSEDGGRIRVVYSYDQPLGFHYYNNGYLKFLFCAKGECKEGAIMNLEKIYIGKIWKDGFLAKLYMYRYNDKLVFKNY
jgi:hypothetical protein